MVQVLVVPPLQFQRAGKLPTWRLNFCRSCSFPVRGQGGQFPNKKLEGILKAKQRALEAELSQSTPAQLEARLTSVKPKSNPFLLLDQVVAQRLKGFTAIIVEVARSIPSEAPASLAERCRDYATWGADAIAVRTDEEVTANGILDLSEVSAAVTVPVMRSDWIIHPIQIAQTSESGASAVRLVNSVLKKGTPAILRYTQALGLDAIVEVVNLKELEEVATLGISAYGINLSVGLSLPIPGFRQDIAKSLVGNLPFGSYSIVQGVSSQEEAIEMRLAGADAVYISQDVLERYEASGNSQEQFLQGLRDSLTGDD
uniref:indole-3-glycerol-phosphate synthase n=1 Tax=Araucaria cunninghamii TaxID=56994 RepID=A0A0D6R5F4_ARACU